MNTNNLQIVVGVLGMSGDKGLPDVDELIRRVESQGRIKLAADELELIRQNYTPQEGAAFSALVEAKVKELTKTSRGIEQE